MCALSGLTIESEFALTGAAMAAMQVSIECEGSDIFVVADGVKIAKLGIPGRLRQTYGFR